RSGLAILSDARFYYEDLAMFRTALFHNAITGLRELPGLRILLQSRLVILGLEAVDSLLQSFRDHPTHHESVGCGDSAVQVDCRNERFHGVHEQRPLGSPAAFFLAAAQAQETAKIHFLSHGKQMG